MTDLVRVPAGDNISDTATLLLAAVEAKDNDFTPADVRTNTHGPGFGFVVPAEVAKAAGLEGEPFGESAPATVQTTETEQAAAEAAALTKDGSTGPDAEKATAKKTAAKRPAKKAAAKKTAAKKSTAKKTAPKA